jgi:hypothetical protein
MSYRVLILLDRRDVDSRPIADWMRVTLDGAGLSCTLAPEQRPEDRDSYRLLVVPTSGDGWRAATDFVLEHAASTGVPILPVQIAGTRFYWPSLARTGALEDLLLLPDLSDGSARQLASAAWARVQIRPLELDLAIYASPGLEPELGRALSILAELPARYGHRVSLRPVLWPARSLSAAHGAVCLLWQDVRTPLEGNEWAVDEWQTVESPSVLLFYRGRPANESLSYEERLERMRRDTAAANGFVQEQLGLAAAGPYAELGRSMAGNPPADFERQLQNYAAARLAATLRSAGGKERPGHAGVRPSAPARPSLPAETDPSTLVPDRFQHPLDDEVAFHLSPNVSSRPQSPPPQALDQAHFAAFAPAAVERQRPFLLEVWACTPGQYGAMLQRAVRREGVSLRGSKSAAAPSVGTALDVAVELPGFTQNEPGDVLVWTGEPASASFILAASTSVEEGWHVGTARISAHDVPFARLRFEILVGRADERPQPLPSSERRISSVFASYAGEDRLEVLQWARGAEAVGVDVFLDALALREAAGWEQELFRHVPSKDLFCLFWSEPARRSVWVEREWRCALAARGIDYIHPVPLEDPREVPPPPELSARHFGGATLLVQLYEKARAARIRGPGTSPNG